MANDITPIPILTNVGATGSGVLFPGGKGTFAVDGTFAGATITLEAQMPNGTWFTVTGSALTAAGYVNIELARASVRGAVGSSSGTAVYATLTPYAIAGY